MIAGQNLHLHNVAVAFAIKHLCNPETATATLQKRRHKKPDLIQADVPQSAPAPQDALDRAPKRQALVETSLSSMSHKILPHQRKELPAAAQGCLLQIVISCLRIGTPSDSSHLHFPLLSSNCIIFLRREGSCGATRCCHRATVASRHSPAAGCLQRTIRRNSATQTGLREGCCYRASTREGSSHHVASSTCLHGAHRVSSLPGHYQKYSCFDYRWLEPTSIIAWGIVIVEQPKYFKDGLSSPSCTCRQHPGTPKSLLIYLIIRVPYPCPRAATLECAVGRATRASNHARHW
jgi:hypothetical protein